MSSQAYGKLGEQLLIAFRVLMVAGVIGGFTMFIKMNNNVTVILVKLEHINEHINRIDKDVEVLQKTVFKAGH